MRWSGKESREYSCEEEKEDDVEDANGVTELRQLREGRWKGDRGSGFKGGHVSAKKHRAAKDNLPPKAEDRMGHQDHQMACSHVDPREAGGGDPNVSVCGRVVQFDFGVVGDGRSEFSSLGVCHGRDVVRS